MLMMREKVFSFLLFFSVLNVTNLDDSSEVEVPHTVLIELLNGGLEPPVGAHEGESHGDLGVHGAQGPVLPEEVDR